MTKPTEPRDALMVTREQAIVFAEEALRNVDRLCLSEDGIDDIRQALQSFASHRLSTAPTPDQADTVARLREALIQARSDFHLIALHSDMHSMWADAKAGRDRVHEALATLTPEKSDV